MFVNNKKHKVLCNEHNTYCYVSESSGRSRVRVYEVQRFVTDIIFQLLKLVYFFYLSLTITEQKFQNNSKSYLLRSHLGYTSYGFIPPIKGIHCQVRQYSNILAWIIPGGGGGGWGTWIFRGAHTFVIKIKKYP